MSATASSAPSARRLPRAAILLGGATVACLVLAALLAPAIAPYDPNAQAMAERFAGASPAHWFGTDGFGRDTFSRILFGLRVSLLVGALSTLLAALVGVGLGLLAGFHGGWIDRALSGANDTLMGIPQMVAGIILVALLGPGLLNLALAIAITAFPAFFRMARGGTIALRARDHVEACRVLGYSNTRILLRHILPEQIDELIVVGTLWLATAIRTEASLSFIGLGLPPPAPTLGGLVRAGFDNLLDAPGLALWPSLVIFLLMIGLNLLGDGLRDANDPRAST